MAFKHNPNTASLFPNEKKEKETHADLNGSGIFACPHCQKETDFWLNAWKKVGQNMKEYYNLTFKPKQQKEEATKPYLAPDDYKAKEPIKTTPFKDLDDSEIPF